MRKKKQVITSLFLIALLQLKLLKGSQTFIFSGMPYLKYCLPKTKILFVPAERIFFRYLQECIELYCSSKLLTINNL